jgi:hypothetical protein
MQCGRNTDQHALICLKPIQLAALRDKTAIFPQAHEQFAVARHLGNRDRSSADDRDLHGIAFVQAERADNALRQPNSNTVPPFGNTHASLPPIPGGTVHIIPDSWSTCHGFMPDRSGQCLPVAAIVSATVFASMEFGYSFAA